MTIRQSVRSVNVDLLDYCESHIAKKSIQQQTEWIRKKKSIQRVLIAGTVLRRRANHRHQFEM